MATRPQRTPRLAPEIRAQQLLDAALAILTERGFDAVTVESVAQRAGVTRPVVYDVFGDLQGLMIALIDREESVALAPLLEILGGEPPEDVSPDEFLVAAVDAFLRAVRANPRTWRLVLMPPRGSSNELRERIRRSRQLLAERISSLLDWGVTRRGGPEGLDHQLLARLIVAAGEDAARLVLAHPRRFPPRRLTGATAELLRLVPADAQPRGEPPPQVDLSSASEGGVGMLEATAPGTRLPRAKRREQLLDAALALLATEGFEALSVEAVARRAGVNRVVVYRNFASLQLLLVALLRREDHRTRRELEPLLPAETEQRSPPQLLGETLARFLATVTAEPDTWGVALLRPESAPIALQKLVNRRRAEVARRLEPLVRWGLGALSVGPGEIDVEVLSRMLLSIGEEQGRLALDDPDFPPERLLASSWRLLDLVPLKRSRELRY
jgi:AcrR family transcriptional regulator